MYGAQHWSEISEKIEALKFKIFEKFPKTIDGRMLNFLFLFLKPYKLLQKKYFGGVGPFFGFEKTFIGVAIK